MSSVIKAKSKRNLMLFSGRAHPELALEIGSGLGNYARRLSDTFVLRDHRKLRRAPELVLSDRVQHLYPSMVTGIAERMFRVDNPAAKPGFRRIVREERKGKAPSDHAPVLVELS